MALIGLINENEFYSDHYLSEIFAGDIRGVLEAWQGKESEGREAQRERAASLGEKPGRYDGYLTPFSRLNGLAQEWLARQQEAENRRGSERITAQLGINKLGTGYFVGADALDDYDEEEKVFVKNPVSGDVLGDFEPRFVIRKLSATKLNALRDETFERIPALKQG